MAYRMAMVRSDAKTPDEYVAALPEERRRMVSAIRETINANLPDGYVEGMAYGMIGWSVPLERFGDTYNGQPLGLVGLAEPEELRRPSTSTSVYADPRWRRGSATATPRPARR